MYLLIASRCPRYPQTLLSHQKRGETEFIVLAHFCIYVFFLLLYLTIHSLRGWDWPSPSALVTTWFDSSRVKTRHGGILSSWNLVTMESCHHGILSPWNLFIRESCHVISSCLRMASKITNQCPQISRDPWSKSFLFPVSGVFTLAEQSMYVYAAFFL